MFLGILFNNTTITSTLNVSGFSALNNNTTLLSTLKSITLNKNNVDSTGDLLNFYYNNPGTGMRDRKVSMYW